MCVPTFPVYTAFLYNWFESSLCIETICFVYVGPQEMLVTYWFPYVQVVLSSSLSLLRLSLSQSGYIDITITPYYKLRNQVKRSMSFRDLGFSICLSFSVIWAKIMQFL
jgi:hypothetical protein